MIDLFAFAIAAAVSQQSGMVRVPVSGRDYLTLDGSTEVFRGTCDGTEVSATIAKAFRGRPGRLILRSGRLSREVPSNFLDGRLVGSSFYAAGLGCDGRRVLFRARVVRMNESGRVSIQVQSVTMDLTSGQLSVSNLRNLSDAEIRLELR